MFVNYRWLIYHVTSNLRCTQHLKKGFSRKKMFSSKYILMSIKFAAILARSLVIRGKFFQNLRRVKNNTSNLRCFVIFNLGKCYKMCFLNSKLYVY
jgi:hypothetical protein